MTAIRQDDRFWSVGSDKLQLSEPSRSLPRHYAPFTTRTPWLVTLLVAVLGCIAALETAFNTGVDPDEPNSPARLVRKQDATSEGEVTIQTSVPETTTFTIPTDLSQDPSSFITITTAITPTSPVEDEPITTLSEQDPDSFITIVTPDPVTSGGGGTTTNGDPITSGAGGTTTNGDPTSQESTDANDFITLDTPDPATTTRGGTSGGSVTSGRVTAESADRDSFITTDTPTSSAAPETFITTNSPTSEDIQLITVITLPPETTARATATATTTDSAGSTVTLSNVVTPTDQTPSLVTLALSPTVLTTVISGSTTVLSTSTTITASSTSSSRAVPSVKSSQVQISTTFEEHDYFLSSYLSVLVAVILKLIWGLVFSGLKMLEPFYQLSKPGGAAASESLLADYLSAAYGWNHVRHIFSGHWVMLFSTLVYVAMATLSPLASEAMGVVATQLCPTSSGSFQPCAPVWVINVPIGRGLEGILIFIAVLILLVIIFNFRRESGIFSNPSSIATMASLVSHDDMLHDLRQIDSSASDASIVAALSGTRYTLKSYTDATGLPRYGITKTESSTTSNPYSLGPVHNFDVTSRSQYAALSNPSNMSLQAHPIQEQKPFSVSWRIVRDVCFLLVILALFGIVLAYYLVGDRSDFNNFFNSGDFGPKFTLTAIAALIDFTWKTIEREVRILVPYRRLAARRATPEKSVLVDVGGVPVSSVWGALRRGEIVHSIVAFTAILSDVLIIAVGGVPFGRGAVWLAYLYSSYLSLAILSWMTLAMVVVFWWRAQVRQLRMPREPDTILSVWLMMADEGNAVLQEYGGWETTRGAERDRAATSRGARYWGGWAKTPDDSERWCIGTEGIDSNLVGYEYSPRY